MFRVTMGKGFHITFDNGYTVSVQFGAGNYCDNYSGDFSKQAQLGEKGSKTAECAVWVDGGDLIEHPSFEGNTVKGYMSAQEVLQLCIWAEQQPRKGE